MSLRFILDGTTFLGETTRVEKFSDFLRDDSVCFF